MSEQPKKHGEVYVHGDQEHANELTRTSDDAGDEIITHLGFLASGYIFLQYPSAMSVWNSGTFSWGNGDPML